MDKYYDEKMTFEVRKGFLVVESVTRFVYHKKRIGPVVRYRGKFYDLFGGEFSRGKSGPHINLLGLPYETRRVTTTKEA